MTDDINDALLNPSGSVEWASPNHPMLIYISRQVSDMALQMLHMVPPHALVFDAVGIYFIVYTIWHVTDTSGVTQKVDCVTAMFPESLSLFVMPPEGVCL